MLAFGLYLQHVVGLEPCPMCIVQRYALVLVALFAGLGFLRAAGALQMAGSAALLLAVGFGAFMAARQSWLQWYPPEVVSCGRDFYGMIETFPLQRALPMIFKGSGDCSQGRLDLPGRLDRELVLPVLLLFRGGGVDPDAAAGTAPFRPGVYA